MKRFIFSAVSLGLLLSSQAVTAAHISVVSSSAEATRCKATDAVKLNVIEETANPGQLNANTYASTTCGPTANGPYWYEGNQHPQPDEANGNFGLRNDGFMNMSYDTLAALNEGSGDSNFIQKFGYSDYIKEEDLTALGTNFELDGNKYVYPNNFNANDGNEDDPGWIKLGSVGDFPDSGQGAAANLADVKGQSLADIIELSLVGNGNKSGTWSLKVKEDAITLAEAILGRPAVFDHLALVLKAGQRVAIYDFNFDDIFGNPVPGANGFVGNDGTGFETGFNFSTPYTFYGEWSTADLDDKGLSNWAMYARDPILGIQQIPAPATALLALLAIVGLMVQRKLRIK